MNNKLKNMNYKLKIKNNKLKIIKNKRMLELMRFINKQMLKLKKIKN